MENKGKKKRKIGRKGGRGKEGEMEGGWQKRKEGGRKEKKGKEKEGERKINPPRTFLHSEIHRASECQPIVFQGSDNIITQFKEPNKATPHPHPLLIAFEVCGPENQSI